MEASNQEQEQKLQPNREHKSSVFSLLFSDPETLRELYSAIEGVPLPSEIPININTLTDVLIKGKINDISFLIDNRLIVLIEHQSTISENMPLRVLRYFVGILERIVDMNKMFNKKQIKIPRPEFIVLYNGENPYPEKSILRLSDAFMDVEGLVLESKTSLELVVQVYNINHGYNKEILQKCETLNGYSLLIDKIREHQKTGLTLAKSIELAVKYCVEKNVLKDFLREHGSEVVNMLFDNYDFDTYMAVVREEGIEIGTAKGREEGIEEGIEIGTARGLERRSEEIARNALAEGSSIEYVQKITGLDPAVINRLQENTGQM